MGEPLWGVDDLSAYFAAVALHKLLAGPDHPETRFEQIADGYGAVCRTAWEVGRTMAALASNQSNGTGVDEDQSA